MSENHNHKRMNKDLPCTDQEVMQQSANNLLGCYEYLSKTNQHLLFPLLGTRTPRQWAHYPEDDVIDRSTGYQYFYHSHSPEDRQNTEHGHFHLFARMDSEKHEIEANTETKFLDKLKSTPVRQSNNVNLLCISLDAKSLPISMSTVNRWVTEDHLLSWNSTLSLLKGFHISTPGYETVNQWLEAMLGLFLPEIVDLLVQRDLKLATLAESNNHQNDLLEDKNIELLSETVIDIDQKIAAISEEEITD